MGSDWVTDTVCEEPMVFTALAGALWLRADPSKPVL